MPRYLLHIFNYIYGNEIEEILSFFREVNSEILAVIGIPDEPVDVAVDFHDIGYYGDKNDEGVRGIKPKKDLLGHSFFTIDLLREPKLTFDIVNITGLNKDYIILIEGVVTRLREEGIKIGVMFLDREFFNLPSILALTSLGIEWRRVPTSG